MGKILTRLGDGSALEMTESELKNDLEDGTRNAATAGQVDPLSEDELKYLLEIYS